MFKQVLAALCDLCWPIIILHCTWNTRNLEKYIVLHGQKPLDMVCGFQWYSQLLELLSRW